MVSAVVTVVGSACPGDDIKKSVDSREMCLHRAWVNITDERDNNNVVDCGYVVGRLDNCYERVSPRCFSRLEMKHLLRILLMNIRDDDDDEMMR